MIVSIEFAIEIIPIILYRSCLLIYGTAIVRPLLLLFDFDENANISLTVKSSSFCHYTPVFYKGAEKHVW